MRRFLRIFPPYYVLLLCLALLTLLSSDGQLGRNSISFWQSIWFHATYTSNFWFAFTGKWDPLITSHFWMWAVEEQFYLFWPWIIISVPKRHLWVAATLMSALGPLFRGILLFDNTNYITWGH